MIISVVCNRHHRERNIIHSMRIGDKDQGGSGIAKANFVLTAYLIQNCCMLHFSTTKLHVIYTYGICSQPINQVGCRQCYPQDCLWKRGIDHLLLTVFHLTTEPRTGGF